MTLFLGVSISGPNRVPIGSTAVYYIIVSNNTSKTAENVEADVRVTQGFIFTDTNSTQKKITIGTIEPGKTVTQQVEVKAESYVYGYITVGVAGESPDGEPFTGNAVLYVNGVPSVETNWKVYTPDTGVAVIKWLYLQPEQVEQLWEKVKNTYYGRLVVAIFEVTVDVNGVPEPVTLILSRRTIRVIGSSGLDADIISKVFEELSLPVPTGTPLFETSAVELVREPWMFARPWTGIAMVLAGYFTPDTIEQVYDTVKSKNGNMIGFTAYCWTSQPGDNSRPEFVLKVYPKMVVVTGRKAKDTDFLNQLYNTLFG